MDRQRHDLRLLLLQIRDDPRVRREEHESFAHHAGLVPEQIEILNVFDTPVFEPAAAQGYDGLFVGGASEASVLETEAYPFVPHCGAMLRWCVEKSMPVLASCFGFQVAVVALGGRVTHNAVDFEMGSVAVNLTLAAAADPLFCDTPDPFMAVSVHQQSAEACPDGCELLARTDVCPHALRVTGKPFWATQFHPEVDRACLVERLGIYRQRYTKSDEHFEKVINAVQETPESNGILRKFVDRVLLA